MNIKKIIIYILSPTYFYADYKKKKLNEMDKAKFVLFKNREYFWFSLLSFILFLLNEMLIKFDIIYTIVPLFYYYFSRINEIFFSFIIDVLDKLNHEYKISFITFKERINLAFFSYIELIINYSLIYWICNLFINAFNKNNLLLINFFYYSGTTITNLGFGDIYATHFIPQILSVYEVINGMMLIIICFTVYLSLNYNKEIYNKIQEHKNNYVPNKKKIYDLFFEFKNRNKIVLNFSILLIILICISSFLIITIIYYFDLVNLLKYLFGIVSIIIVIVNNRWKYRVF